MKTRTPSKSGVRAEDKTTLTISLTKELKAMIEAAAEADERSVSNYLSRELQRHIEELQAARKNFQVLEKAEMPAKRKRTA